MAEYIERETAVKAILGKENREIKTDYEFCLGLIVASNAVSDVPAADVVPVVRCKDCRYMAEHYDTDGNAQYWTCSEWDGGTDYDGYCHYGERKTMKWNEFNREISVSRSEEETTVECPNSGKNIFLRKNVVLTSYPPQFGYFCKSCGWAGTSFVKWNQSVKWNQPVVPTSVINAALKEGE